MRKPVTTAAIDAGHPANMGCEIAVADKFRQRDLHRTRHHLAGMALQPLECLDEALGHDRVADADIRHIDFEKVPT